MKTWAWVLLILGALGVVVWIVMRKGKASAPVVVTQSPTKQTAAQKANEWIGVIGSLNDPVKNLKSIFSNGSAAASAA